MASRTNALYFGVVNSYIAVNAPRLLMELEVSLYLSPYIILAFFYSLLMYPSVPYRTFLRELSSNHLAFSGSPSKEHAYLFAACYQVSGC